MNLCHQIFIESITEEAAAMWWRKRYTGSAERIIRHGRDRHAGIVSSRKRELHGPGLQITLDYPDDLPSAAKHTLDSPVPVELVEDFVQSCAAPRIDALKGIVDAAKRWNVQVDPESLVGKHAGLKGDTQMSATAEKLQADLALEKKRADRYQTAAEFAAALRSVKLA